MRLLCVAERVLGAGSRHARHCDPQPECLPSRPVASRWRTQSGEDQRTQSTCTINTRCASFRRPVVSGKEVVYWARTAGYHSP